MGPVTKKPRFDPTKYSYLVQHHRHGTRHIIHIVVSRSICICAYPQCSLPLWHDATRGRYKRRTHYLSCSLTLSLSHTCAPSLSLVSRSLFSSLSPPRTVSSPRNGSCRTGRTEWGRNHSEPSHCARARQSWRCCTASAVAWQRRRHSMTRGWNRVRAPSRGSEGCYGARARSAPDSPRSGAAGGSPEWRGRGKTWS